MSDKINKSSVLSSLFWKFMERGGSQGIQFVMQIILARLLFPEDYGIIALVTIFISLASVFVQSGLNTALIQKKNADEVDFSSVFYLNLSLAVLFYTLLFFASPSIANFYRQPELKLVLRVLSLTLFFGAFNSIQISFVARNMLFKKQFFSTLGAVFVSGIVGITAAYRGLGVWALVIQQLTRQAMLILLLWHLVKWRPHLVFSIKRAKVLFSYGWKLLASGLLNTIYMDIRTLIIGRIHSPAALGFYNRGKQFPQVIVSNIDGSIQTVMLPTLSSQQENKNRVKDMVRRSIITSSFIMFPMMAGLAVVAEPMVRILLTEKWMKAVPFIQIFCISYSLMPIHTANLQAIQAVGRSDIFLKLEIIKKIYGLVLLAISVPFGIYAMAWSSVLSGVVSSFVNAHPNKELLDYSYKEQWRDIMPSLSIALVMGVIVYLINFLNIAAWQILILQIITGAVLYFGFAKMFAIESFDYLTTTMKELVIRRKRKAA
ncbi:MAG: lipopolysaccharide biosynthesis protein [Natronincolaceae bacterium]